MRVFCFDDVSLRFVCYLCVYLCFIWVFKSVPFEDKSQDMKRRSLRLRVAAAAAPQFHDSKYAGADEINIKGSEVESLPS